LIVTSFSKEGYEQYGRKFVESYRKYCPYPLVIYSEDDLGIGEESLWDIPGCKPFVDLVANETTRNIQNGYRFNTHKFCRKVFATNHIASTFKGQFAWLDADTVFHADMPENFLNDILTDCYLAYLGRKVLHSETGFMAFDTEHNMNSLFQLLYLREYTSGAYHHLRYWCDSDIFDHVRVLLSPPENNMNGNGEELEAFEFSVLSKYLTHNKGGKKC
jgi:hypothetical protein